MTRFFTTVFYFGGFALAMFADTPLDFAKGVLGVAFGLLYQYSQE